MPGAHKIGAAISGTKIADGKITNNTRLLLIQKLALEYSRECKYAKKGLAVSRVLFLIHLLPSPCCPHSLHPSPPLSPLLGRSEARAVADLTRGKERVGNCLRTTCQPKDQRNRREVEGQRTEGQWR